MYCTSPPLPSLRSILARRTDLSLACFPGTEKIGRWLRGAWLREPRGASPKRRIARVPSRVSAAHPFPTSVFLHQFSYISYRLLAGGALWVQLAPVRTPQTIRSGQQSMRGRMLLGVAAERVAARAQAPLTLGGGHEVMSSESAREVAGKIRIIRAARDHPSAPAGAYPAHSNASTPEESA